MARRGRMSPLRSSNQLLTESGLQPGFPQLRFRAHSLGWCILGTALSRGGGHGICLILNRELFCHQTCCPSGLSQCKWLRPPGPRKATRCTNQDEECAEWLSAYHSASCTAPRKCFQKEQARQERDTVDLPTWKSPGERVVVHNLWVPDKLLPWISEWWATSWGPLHLDN